jgi:hypothetical protein
MKLALAWILYHIGDKFSYFMMKTGLGYGIYCRIMLMSCKLDKNCAIWKLPKDSDD